MRAAAAASRAKPFFASPSLSQLLTAEHSHSLTLTHTEKSQRDYAPFSVFFKLKQKTNMETLHPAALLQQQRGDDRCEQRTLQQRVPLGQLDRAGSAANVLSSPGADARRTLKVRE